MERTELELRTKRWLERERTTDAYEGDINDYLCQNNYRLYKYQSPFAVQGISDSDETAFDRFYNHIEQKTITLSAPSVFNDPFDCLYALPLNCSVNIMRAVKKANDCYNRVGCLAEGYDNRLMWSHYGADHQGVCIEYDVTNLSVNQKELLFAPVVYSRKPVLIPECIINSGVAMDPLTDTEKSLLTEGLFTKDQIWSYEKEWRIIRRKDYTHETEKHINFLMPAIRTIYLGAGISNFLNYSSKENRQVVDQLIRLKRLCEKKEIRLQMLTLNPNTYGLKLGKCLTE